MEDITKLPKWAQTKIRLLENDLKAERLKLSQFTGESATNTYRIELMDELPLPNNSQIKFDVDKKGSTKVYINDGTVHINTDSRYGYRTVLVPVAANTFYIDFLK